MGMTMHDHTKKPKTVWCPLMKEICRDGWTASMGEDAVTKDRPVCVRWRGVFLNNPQATPPIQEVFDCADGWMTDLIQQVAQEVYQGAAATEQARNHIAGQAGSFKRLSTAFVAMARRNGVTAQEIMEIEEEQEKKQKALENKGNVPPLD